MKQLFQNLKTGQISLEELPVPSIKCGHLLIQTTYSLVSLGTERMLLEFGNAGWLSKAKQQPDKVKQVIKKLKTDGIEPTIRSVFNKLDSPMPLGYCSVGVVIDTGSHNSVFKKGDRVISNGSHSEMVLVAEHLCAKIPDEVDDATASFTVLSSIGLQGIRLINPTLGESVAVIGLGLIGLVSCQILKANGCRVIGFDFDQSKVELARKFGVEAWNVGSEVDPVNAALAFSDGNGVDAILITASTESNDPISIAPKMCRKRGRVVLVGVTGLELNRNEFFKKEISFLVSCSYGPGRYEDIYEKQGYDYPLGFVRWTEQRNFMAILELMKEKKLVVNDLITKTVPFLDAPNIYSDAVTDSTTLGLVFKYPKVIDTTIKSIRLYAGSNTGKNSKVKIGLIGAGNYTGATLLPALVKADATLVGIASTQGQSSNYLGKKFKFSENVTDYRLLLGNPDINTIIISTQHNSHASLVIESLKAEKHVFVEKPLALNQKELIEVSDEVAKHPDLNIMVGFNRRFSPLIIKAKELLANRQSPVTMSMMVNAGAIPKDHWVHSATLGGGRIIGEGCHFIDLLMHIASSPVVSVYADKVGSSLDTITDDKVSIHLHFADGSIGSIHYFANGDNGFPKERLEIFSDNRILNVLNFKQLIGYGFNDFKKLSLRTQDKGHENELMQFADSIANGSGRLINFAETENVTQASFAAVDSLKNGSVNKLPLKQ